MFKMEQPVFRVNKFKRKIKNKTFNLKNNYGKEKKKNTVKITKCN